MRDGARPARPLGRPCTVWTVSDGRAGHALQAEALAAALGVEPRRFTVPARGWFPLRPPNLTPDPAPPWPDLLIGCGRRAAPSVLALGERTGARTVQIQSPGPALARRFTLVAAPAHDRLTGPNVVVTHGALSRVTNPLLAAARAAVPDLATLPGPRVAVLIGGPSRAFLFGPSDVASVVVALEALARAGAGLMVTLSRRTPPALAEALRAALAGRPHALYAGHGENPYLAYLGWAEAALVTADSVAMVSDALAAGLPTQVLPLAGGTAKFRRFHAGLVSAGLVRPWAGRLERWTFTPPGDTQRVARAVLAGSARL